MQLIRREVGWSFLGTVLGILCLEMFFRYAEIRAVNIFAVLGISLSVAALAVASFKRSGIAGALVSCAIIGAFVGARSLVYEGLAKDEQIGMPMGVLVGMRWFCNYVLFTLLFSLVIRAWALVRMRLLRR